MHQRISPEITKAATEAGRAIANFARMTGATDKAEFVDEGQLAQTIANTMSGRGEFDYKCLLARKLIFPRFPGH